MLKLQVLPLIHLYNFSGNYAFSACIFMSDSGESAEFKSNNNLFKNVATYNNTLGLIFNI